MGDLKQAGRALARAPLLSAVIVLSLGIGVGANTVVFSWVEALLVRPLPGVADARRFHLIEPETDAGVRPGASWLEYRDLRDSLRAFDDVLAFRMMPLTLGAPPETVRAYALLVSGNYFSVLGLQPAIGRFFRDDEVAHPGREPFAVVSFDYWQAHLGGRADAIGGAVRANGSELTIIGVTPEGFQGTVLGLQFDFWVPATLAPVLFAGSRELEDRTLRSYSIMGALGDGVSLEQAQADTARAMQQLAADFPESNGGMTARVLPFWRAGRGPQVMLLQALAILQGIMLLLLLAVCGNTANLVFARASTRFREVGVRLAIGASRWRVVRLLLAESLVLGLLASALGVVIAWWGTTALRAVPLFTTQFPVRFQTDLNVETLAFAALLGLCCGLLFGAAPAVQLARISPQSALRSGAGPGARSGIRTALMTVQVALAVAVLVIAGLILESFEESRQADPGFEVDGVLLASYDLAGRGIDRAGTRQFADRVLTNVRAIPGVEAAALAVSIPLDIHGLPQRTFDLEGRARTTTRPDRTLSNTVTSGYFRTMGIPFVAGEDFAELNDADAPPQAIVNEEFVRRHLGEAEAVGRRITMGDTSYTVVGVVRTSLNDSFSEPPTPVVYLSYRDRPTGFAEMHLRTRAGDENMLAAAVRRVVRELDPSLPVFNVRTLAQHVEMNVALRRIPARMFMVLGPLILALAAIGIYAVVAYSVSHRTAEIGVRMALGASAGTVLRQIVVEHFRFILGGVLAGWAFVAYMYTQLMRGSIAPGPFIAVPALLLAIAVIACWLPARRASRVDPVTALRAE
jgi:predicted permease